MQPQQPRTYLVRLHKRNREALDGREYTTVLDFSPGPGLRATHGQLDGIVQALAWTDGARGPETLHYRLEIFDPEDRKNIRHWPATSWREMD